MSFSKYWNDNILDQLGSTQINLSNLFSRSWDPDNPIERIFFIIKLNF